MPSARDRTTIPLTRNIAALVERADAWTYPPVALLVFATLAACAFSLLSAPRFDAESGAILAVVGVILALSGRYSHPVPRLAIAVAYLGVLATVVGDMGVAGYLAELADGRDMGDPVRTVLFTAAQLVATLLAVAARRLPG